jgi:hypothetical protein
MSTLALPITDLSPLVGKAKDGTRLVKECSYAEEASLKVVWQIALGTFAVRRRLSQLTAKQHSFLAELTSIDFTHCTDDQLKELALAIQRIVADERAIVNDAQTLGSEVRLWWQNSLHTLLEQAEHLDSIVESLWLECDAEAPLLLSMAAMQVA